MGSKSYTITPSWQTESPHYAHFIILHLTRNVFFNNSLFVMKNPLNIWLWFGNNFGFVTCPQGKKYF